jgi:hypothetical protein
MLCTLALATFIATLAAGAWQDTGGQGPAQPGADYAGLGPRRQHLIDDWVKRFNTLTRRNLQPAAFYDSEIKLSTKTTFDAITYALERTPLTAESGQTLGDTLDLVQSVESTRGQVMGAAGDRQFRMYVVLTEGALDKLERSQEFNRGVDNTVFHKGYPINYRQQGGFPSIQISIATDKRRADIDVDYRSSRFPISLVNGHLTAANSDVRSGNNYDRHTNKWAGFQNWWLNVFGVRVVSAPAAKDDGKGLVPNVPRAGDKNIEVMVEDFLKAWLVDGDIPAAMSYMSERSYACVVEDSDDPFSVDRGIAPFVLAGRLDAARHALGPPTSLDGLTIGVRLPNSALRVVNQPRHAQFVIYSVPDDVAAEFDCESRLTPGDSRKIPRRYGNYFGATFYINTPRGMNHSIALLWGRNDGYWKIVSWRSDPAGDDLPARETGPPVKVARMKAEPALVTAATNFLESWLIRRDYDAAFRYLSPKSYPCYDLLRDPGAPASTSVADAGQKLRANLERAGTMVGTPKTLDEVLEGPEVVHPTIRVVEHPFGRAFTLGGLPDAFAETISCSAPARRERYRVEDATSLVYGNAFGKATRVRTRSGEAPVVRMLWMKDADAWRITAYDVVTP